MTGMYRTYYYGFPDFRRIIDNEASFTYLPIIMKPALKEKFLIDEKGHKQAVLIDIERYQELVEDIADLRVIAERKNNPKLSAANFTLRLKKHGIL